jgi:hypothetical protein
VIHLLLLMFHAFRIHVVPYFYEHVVYFSLQISKYMPNYLNRFVYCTYNVSMDLLFFF